MTARSSQRRHGATARVRPAQGTQNRPFRDQEQAPPCPGIRSQKETEIDDPTYTLQPVANRNGMHRQRCVAPSGPGNLTAPTGYNCLPCDSSRVDRAGTVKPANRGAREVPKHHVTMTKQRTLHSLPEGEPLKTQTWITQKRQGQDVSVQSDRKTRPPDVRRSSPSPSHVLKNQRDTPGRVTTGQEPQNPRHYARSEEPRRTGTLALQNKHLKDSEPSGKGRDGQIDPASGVKPW